MKDVKPLVYWTYYPKLGRGFWRVSRQPRNTYGVRLWLWTIAHKQVIAENKRISEDRSVY